MEPEPDGVEYECLWPGGPRTPRDASPAWWSQYLAERWREVAALELRVLTQELRQAELAAQPGARDLGIATMDRCIVALTELFDEMRGHSHPVRGGPPVSRQSPT